MSIFVTRPIGTSLLALAIALAGLAAYLALPVAPLPRVDMPVIAVTAAQPGADPIIMATSVAAPLERRLGSIAGINEMTSTSSLGTTNIILQFDLNRSIESAARDVQAAINAAQEDLPTGLAAPPSFRRLNPADQPILIIAMTSATLSPGQMYDVADSVIGPRITQVNGVASVGIAGGEQPAVRVAVDPSAATSAGVSFEAIRTAIIRANVTAPTGLIDGRDQSAAIDTGRPLSTPADFGAIIVRQSGGAMVRLDSIASVEDGPRDRRQSGLYNGRPAIILTVFKQADANVLEVVDDIRARIPAILRWIPPGIEITIVRDRSLTIRASVREVSHALIISIALVVVVVALFLRRASAIFAAGIAVPLSLLGTLATMWLLNFSLNNITLMALTISVGFVVDDAIVMIENMTRLMERGERPIPAAIKAIRQIGFTVVSMSVSLIAVFIPLLFLGGVVGRMFNEFAMTLAVAVALSAVISLTITPMFAAQFGRATPPPPGRFFRGFERMMDVVIDAYIRSLTAALRWRHVMVVLTLALVVGTVYLYRIVPKAFFPDQDSGLLVGSAQAQPDTSFQAMVGYQRRIVEVIRADPAVAGVTATIGGGGFFGSSGNIRLQIALKPLAERPGTTGFDVVTRLRGPLATVTGVQTFLRVQPDINLGGRSTNAGYQFVLLTSDLDALQRWSELMVRQLQTMPETLADVSSDQQRTGLVSRLHIDREAAARLGVNINDIGNALNDSFAQRQISTIYRTRNQYRVILEVDPSLTQAPEDLMRIHVPGRAGPVPLGTLVRLERSIAPRSVTHQGSFAASTISFNLPDGVSLGTASAAIERAALAIQMPASVRGEFAGNALAFRGFLSGLPLLVLGALVVIYITLGVLYENLLHPLTILSTLPTAGIGALLALLATNTPFSMIAFIGVILLMGIVKKNAIMMVDFALHHQRDQGSNATEAILLACRERFRPILMTTLAGVFGAVPLALATGPGAELRQPLGITIIGGMLLAQVITLYTTPAIYLAFDRPARAAGVVLPAE